MAAGSRSRAKAILSPPFEVGDPELLGDGEFYVPSDFSEAEIVRVEELVNGGMTPEEAIAQVISERNPESALG